MTVHLFLTRVECAQQFCVLAPKYCCSHAGQKVVSCVTLQCVCCSSPACTKQELFPPLQFTLLVRERQNLPKRQSPCWSPSLYTPTATQQEAHTIQPCCASLWYKCQKQAGIQQSLTCFSHCSPQILLPGKEMVIFYVQPISMNYYAISGLSSVSYCIPVLLKKWLHVWLRNEADTSFLGACRGERLEEHYKTPHNTSLLFSRLWSSTSQLKTTKLNMLQSIFSPSLMHLIFKEEFRLCFVYLYDMVNLLLSLFNKVHSKLWFI